MKPAVANRPVTIQHPILADFSNSEAGISALPATCRPGIYAARFIYAGIGGRLTGMAYDSISARARTSKAQKLGWLAQSVALSASSTVMPQSAVLYAKPEPEVQFLVDAAAQGAPQHARSDALISVLTTLENHSKAQRTALIAQRARAG